MHPTPRRARPVAYAPARLHRWLGLALLLGAGLLLATLRPTPARAATITVTTLADPSLPVDTCSLRLAVQAATTQQPWGSCPAGTGNDTIQFAQGLTGTITLTQGIIFVSSVLCSRTPCSLTIDGPGSGSLAIDGGGKTQLFSVDPTTQLTLEGLTLQNGSHSRLDGGAIAMNDATVSISNCAFSDNSSQNGGAIYSALGGSLTITDSTFTNNQAPDQGVENNDGGAIYSNGTSLSITGSTFSNNSAQDNGGAIYQYGAPFSLSGSTFTGNQSNNDNGGAIYNYEATTTITTSTFDGNQVPTNRSGGGIYNYYGSLSISASTFTNNQSNGGAGIYNDGGTLSVTNSTFTANDGGGGGSAIYSNGQNVTISSSTIAGNNITLTSPALFITGGSASLLNSVLANGPAPNCQGSISDQGGNLADDNSCGFTQASSHANVNPQLGPLQDNGGPIQTMALQPGSPAIGAAVNCPPPTTDQRGQPRTAPCDSGAYQTEAGTAVAGDPPITPMTVSGRARRQVPPLVNEGVETQVVPAVGRTVQALIGGVVCGQSVTDEQGRFQLSVASDPPTAGCGRPGAAVTFRVNGAEAASDPLTFRSGGRAEVTLILPGPVPPPRR